MANIRPKDLLPTADRPAADDYLLLDGAIEGTRKILANSIASSTGGHASVDGFGAVGDGVADDTAAIKAALAAASTIHFPPGKTYITDTIVIPSGKTLFGYGATLKLKTFDGSAANYKSVLDTLNATNIGIYGLTIDGSRYLHTNTGSITTDLDGGMMAIRLVGAQDIKIVDVVGKDCFSDGLYIGDDRFLGGTPTLTQPARITVERCLFDNNRRQGCSIITGTDIYFSHTGFTNTNGTAPQYGVDLEPDPGGIAHETIRRVYFDKCWFTGNAGKGFGMLVPGHTVEDVVLRDCNVTGNTEDWSIWPNVNNSGTLRRFAIIGGKFDKICRIGQSGAAGDRNALIEDCLIQGCALSGDAAIHITNTLGNGRNVTIRDVSSKSITPAEFIRVYDAEGVLIENVTTEGGTRIIRSTTTAKRLTIRDCHMRGNSSDTIALSGTIDDLLIENNRIDKGAVSAPAFLWSNGARAKIRGNTITGSAGNWLTTGAGTSALVLGHNEKGGRGQSVGGTNARQYTIAAI